MEVGYFVFGKFYFIRFRIRKIPSSDPVIAMYFTPDGSGGYQRSPSKSSKNQDILFLWGQSVFIIAQLLTAGLLHINELDMIRRYLPSYNRPRKGGRYSAFQVRIIHLKFLTKKKRPHVSQCTHI